jgi:hypothetical protein
MPEIIIASKIAQPRSPASLLVTELVRVTAAVVSPCTGSALSCVDLSCNRDSGTQDYAIELPIFRRSITPRALN